MILLLSRPKHGLLSLSIHCPCYIYECAVHVLIWAIICFLSVMYALLLLIGNILMGHNSLYFTVPLTFFHKCMVIYFYHDSIVSHLLFGTQNGRCVCTHCTAMMFWRWANFFLLFNRRKSKQTFTNPRSICTYRVHDGFGKGWRIWRIDNKKKWNKWDIGERNF